MNLKEYIEPDIYSSEDFRYLLNRYSSKAKEVHTGRNRIVFDMGSYVIKLPTCALGYTDNVWEGNVSCDEYARTRFIEYRDIPIILMEKVTPYKFKTGEDIPDWVYGIDCGQVGYNSKGRLVAYDYGRY